VAKVEGTQSDHRTSGSSQPQMELFPQLEIPITSVSGSCGFCLINPSLTRDLGDNTIYSLLLPTMAGVDHTKSLMPYADIFQEYEEQYRGVSKAKRYSVTQAIAVEIRQRAEKSQASILYGDALHTVCDQLP